MTTTRMIAIDSDRNGNYTDTYDDVPDRVISNFWFLGLIYYCHQPKKPSLNLQPA